MPAPAFDQITFIVRHCGEHTTDACAQLLGQLAPGNRIHRVSARPFHAVLRQSLELGLAEGRPWTLCIDADVLILPEIADFLSAVDSYPAGFFEAQALVLDKLIPSRRPAGNHLYRTELIGRALAEIPLGDSLRPESDMILAMAAKGHRSHQSSMLIGLHDFAQAYRDVYAKAFLHAHKHDFLMPLVRPLWTAQSRADDDFRVALRALDDALQGTATPRLSRDFPDEPVEQALAAMQLSPKAPLSAIAPADVAGMLRAATAEPDPGARALLDRIQARIDAAVFPADTLATRGAALLARMLRGLRNS